MYRVISTVFFPAIEYKGGRVEPSKTFISVYEFDDQKAAVTFSAFLQERAEMGVIGKAVEPTVRPYTLHGAVRAVRMTVKRPPDSFSCAFILEENCKKYGGDFKIACQLWLEKFGQDVKGFG